MARCREDEGDGPRLAQSGKLAAFVACLEIEITQHDRLCRTFRDSTPNGSVDLTDVKHEGLYGTSS